MSPVLQSKVAKLRSLLSERFLEFKPYIKAMPIEGCPLRFFYGTPQAAEWYDPLQPHNRAEFEWLARHVGGGTHRIIDAGAYHGLYTLVLARSAGPASQVVAVDPVPSNCALIEVNLALNGLAARIEACAISNTDGEVNFTREGCGRIVARGGMVRPARRLCSIMPDATLVKLDIEGAEFSVLPEQIDELPAVHTWIVEIHPGLGDPRAIFKAFADRSYDLCWLNRADGRIERYPETAPWTTRTSLIALRCDGRVAPPS